MGILRTTILSLMVERQPSMLSGASSNLAEWVDTRLKMLGFMKIFYQEKDNHVYSIQKKALLL